MKKSLVSIAMAVVMLAATSATAFAAEVPDGTSDGVLREHGKTAVYMTMTDAERAELKSQLFENLTDEEKAALIEKIGGGKGGALGQNPMGGKAKAFASMTQEERAELRAQIFANLTDEEKAALIEKIGAGKGGALGQNTKGGKGKAFASMTDEEKAALRSERNLNGVVEQQ